VYEAGEQSELNLSKELIIKEQKKKKKKKKERKEKKIKPRSNITKSSSA
jgi:hypothetical protein